jgi:transketolase
MLCEAELLSESELRTLRHIGSRLQGHPDMVKLPLLDAGTGALGQGLSISIGYALAATMRNTAARSYCIVGDGELQEGQIWEAAMFAGARRLSNLCCFVDANRLQNETWVEATLPLGNIADKWKSFGWIVEEIDGHDIPAIRAALSHAVRQPQGPSLILAHTVKGKGVSFMENDNAWHGKGMNESEYRRAVDELAVVLRQYEAI